MLASTHFVRVRVTIHMYNDMPIANLPKFRFLEDSKTDMVSPHSSGHQPFIDNHSDSHSDSSLEKKTCIHSYGFQKTPSPPGDNDSIP